MPSRNPLFTASPVIVIHFGTDETEEGKTLAVCSGEKFFPDSGDSYKNIHRVLCPGCLNATKRALGPTHDLEKALAYLWKIRREAEATTINDDPNKFVHLIIHLADCGMGNLRQDAQIAAGKRFHGNRT